MVGKCAVAGRPAKLHAVAEEAECRRAREVAGRCIGRGSRKMALQ